jgi:DNA replication protein DnaC
LAQVSPRRRNLNGSLFLHGPAGTGKTHLAVALLREHLKEFESIFPGRFVEVPELLMEIRDTFREKAEHSEMELLDRYSCCELLVLDDLGAEKPSEWVTQTLYLLINRRYTGEKRTIVTSNLSLPQLSERLGDRIVSRLAGMCEVVELTGKDRRLKRVK